MPAAPLPLPPAHPLPARHNKSMANMPGLGETVDGKRLVPQLAVGCIVFAIVMGVITVAFAKLTTPYFEKISRDARAKVQAQETQGHKP